MRRARVSYALGAVLVFLGVLVGPAAATAAPAGAAVPSPRSEPLRAPDTALGGGWRGSDDVVLASSADTDGYHLFLARERDAYRWTTLATLGDSAQGTGSWTGHACLTGSGRYAVAVYAPASYTNSPALMEAGGTAVVVDVASGAVHEVATGIQLAYFDPSCGPTDRVLLTRAVGADERRTELVAVDAARASAGAPHTLAGQVTNPLVGRDGVSYGIAAGALVRVDGAGRLHRLARPAGRVFALSASTGPGVDVASVSGDRVLVQRYRGGVVGTVATGPADHTQLFGLSGGREAVVGARIRPSATGIVSLPSTTRVASVSRAGHLLVDSIVSHRSPAAAGAADPGHVGVARATVRPVHSGQPSTQSIVVRGGARFDAATRAPRRAAVGPFDAATPRCVVPRNDVHRQALQPSTNMVEWAVDQAVHGRLMVTRPADYLATGEPSYAPQRMFPPPSIGGAPSGTVPAQVMLGILAQETNLEQASFHAVAGDAGNPAISDYYGNRRSDGSVDLDSINYPGADCGYGIGQVTTGMAVGDRTDYGPADQVAIATDYAANIAASLQILVSKWNQLRQDGLSVNNGDPRYVEDWYLALWAYNSGYYPASESGSNDGQYGVGWLNNPANPVYDPTRDGFLRDSYDDASHPSDWPYQERVLGWAETPQLKYDLDDDSYNAYRTPVLGTGGELSVPLDGELGLFCDDTNGCAYPSGDPCPAVDDTCWWHHANATWASCATRCATESLAFALGSAEPGIRRVYARDCTAFTGAGDPYRVTGRSVVLVDDLADQTDNALGCAGGATTGTFTIRTGWPSGTAGELPQIDLHQLGAGYLGHLWFTHVYPPDTTAGGGGNTHREILGTWTPRLTGGGYDILVHLPSHGAGFAAARYRMFDSSSATTAGTCVINQDSDDGSDSWVYLGHRTLAAGARVELTNIGPGTADGTVDLAYDAMAFVPSTGGTQAACGLPYAG